MKLEGDSEMNFLQRELKKILEMTQYSQEATCIGNASYVKVNGDVRLRLGFRAHPPLHSMELS